MPVSTEDAIHLVKEKALEYAYMDALLWLLDADIDIRRKIEELQKAQFLQRHSIRVERSREELQAGLPVVKQELEDAIRLLALTAIKDNERHNRH